MHAAASITAPDVALPDAAWRGAARRRLLSWYRRAARTLPWRRSRDPYRVWLSEVMLQQTQVSTVAPYFERFVAALPTIESLAAAEPQQVLKLWEGLGYYRRARQLQRAAQEIVRLHGGKFPRDAEAVRRLPGIGRYTAGAVLSIAFDMREPILEANTVRLFARLLAYRGDPATTAGQKLLWRFAAAMLPREKPGTLNQALMELGSLVCLPRTPRCGECPLESLCPTAADGLQAIIPPPKRKPRVEQVREAAVVVRRRGRVLLVLRQPQQRWAGMWDFPRFPLEAESPAATSRELADKTQSLYGVTIAEPRPLATIRHSVTRFRITLDCFAAQHVATARHNEVETRWATVAQLDALPLCASARRLAGKL